MRYIVHYRRLGKHVSGTGIPVDHGKEEFTDYWGAAGFYDGIQEGGYTVRWEESST